MFECGPQLSLLQLGGLNQAKRCAGDKREGCLEVKTVICVSGTQNPLRRRDPLQTQHSWPNYHKSIATLTFPCFARDPSFFLLLQSLHYLRGLDHAAPRNHERPLNNDAQEFPRPSALSVLYSQQNSAGKPRVAWS